MLILPDPSAFLWWGRVQSAVLMLKLRSVWCAHEIQLYRLQGNDWSSVKQYGEHILLKLLLANPGLDKCILSPVLGAVDQK